MSGYAVTIRAFLPCGKDSQAHIEAFKKFAIAVSDLNSTGFLEVEVTNEFKPNRKAAKSEETTPAVDASPAAC